MSWNNTNGCGGCGSETPTKTCCEELLETQKVEITDQNGVKSIHTAISEAVETNNKLDEVIVEKNGVKKISVDAEITIPPVEIDKTGLSTEAKQDATITALNEAKTEIVNAINNINVDVDLSPTNAILEEMKSQNQAQIDIANAIKTELEKKTDQTELVTEVDRIIAAIQAGGGGGSQIDYTTQLADILAKLQLIIDKEDVEIDYTALLNGLGDKLDTTNNNIVKLEGQYNQVLADILAKLQAINTNTDELESQIKELIEKPGYDDTALKQVISDFQSVMLAESDETQTLITSFKDEVKAENDETQELLKIEKCEVEANIFLQDINIVYVETNATTAFTIKNIRLNEVYNVPADGTSTGYYAENILSAQELTDVYEVDFEGTITQLAQQQKICLKQGEKSITQLVDDLNTNLDVKLTDTNAKLSSIEGNTNLTNTRLSTTNTSLSTLNTKTDTTNAKLDTTNAKLDTINTNLTSFRTESKAESDETQALLKSAGCAAFIEGVKLTSPTILEIEYYNPISMDIRSLVQSIFPTTITLGPASSSMEVYKLSLNVPSLTTKTTIEINYSGGGTTEVVGQTVNGVFIVESIVGCVVKNMSLTETNIIQNSQGSIQIEKLTEVVNYNGVKNDTVVVDAVVGVDKPLTLANSSVGILGDNEITDLMIINQGNNEIVLKKNGVVFYKIPVGWSFFRNGTRDYTGETYTIQSGDSVTFNYQKEI